MATIQKFYPLKGMMKTHVTFIEQPPTLPQAHNVVIR